MVIGVIVQDVIIITVDYVRIHSGIMVTDDLLSREIVVKCLPIRNKKGFGLDHTTSFICFCVCLINER